MPQPRSVGLAAVDPPLAEARWQRCLRGALRRLGPVPLALLLAAGGLLLAAPAIGAVAALAGTAAAALAAAAALLVALPAAAALVRLGGRVDDARRRLALAATRDELTGLANRRQFLAAAETERARCRRYEVDAALLVVDADHFASLNATHGRDCGDLLLRELARVIGHALRQPDLLARYGGNAFAVFLPHTDLLGALDVAERIRVQAGDLRVDCRGLAVGLSVSVGVAPVGPGHGSLDALLLDADAALQAAKHAGRNCVRAVSAARTRPSHGLPLGTRRPTAGPV